MWFERSVLLGFETENGLELGTPPTHEGQGQPPPAAEVLTRKTRVDISNQPEMKCLMVVSQQTHVHPHIGPPLTTEIIGMVCLKVRPPAGRGDAFKNGSKSEAIQGVLGSATTESVETVSQRR